MSEDVLQSANIVSGIANGEGLFAQDLPTSHQTCHGANLGKTSLDGFLAYLNATFAKQTNGGEDSARVFLLTQASQRRLKVTPPKGELEGTFLSKGNGSTNFVCFVLEDGLYLWVDVLANADGNAWLDDACFLAGYLGKRVAKELNMVEADVGNDGKDGRDNVCAVQPAAQAYFYDGEVHFLFFKVFKG